MKLLIGLTLLALVSAAPNETRVKRQDPFTTAIKTGMDAMNKMAQTAFKTSTGVATAGINQAKSVADKGFEAATGVAEEGFNQMGNVANGATEIGKTPFDAAADIGTGFAGEAAGSAMGKK